MSRVKTQHENGDSLGRECPFPCLHDRPGAIPVDDLGALYTDLRVGWCKALLLSAVAVGTPTDPS